MLKKIWLAIITFFKKHFTPIEKKQVLTVEEMKKLREILSEKNSRSGKITKAGRIVRYTKCRICGTTNRSPLYRQSNGEMVCQDCIQKELSKVSHIKTRNEVRNALH
jgi:formylmethanofuran dehydrogenase subunit E